MRKAYIALLVLVTLLVMGLSGAAFAADTEETTKVGKNVYFTLGYKSWFNTWQTAFNSYPPEGGANIMTITSDTVAAPIFSASLIPACSTWESGGVSRPPRMTVPLCSMAL